MNVAERYLLPFFQPFPPLKLKHPQTVGCPTVGFFQRGRIAKCEARRRKLSVRSQFLVLLVSEAIEAMAASKIKSNPTLLNL